MKHVEQIKQMCDDIYEITGIKAVFYDADMRCVYFHPGSMGPFCSCIRQDTELTEACLRCDREGFAQCRKTGELVIYQCHMGLTEAVAPVLDNEVVIGYILFGQLLSEGAREKIQENIYQGNYPHKAVLLQALAEMEPTEDSVIKASARLMAMCASYIRLRNILKIRQESLAAHIDEFLSRNLADQSLSIERICREFGISRGTLYTVSKNAFGVGVTEYIRKQRIKRAIRLIRQGGIPIYRVAEEAGFADPNYMAKVIKAETGLTPKKIQKTDL